MAGLNVNPVVQTNVSGFFTVDTTGQYQGVFLDDPALRNELDGGFLSSSATDPIWGGCAITATNPTPSSQAPQLGKEIALATAETNLTGFTVFNQGTAMLMSAQSRVPLSFQGMGVNFVALGSGLRVIVNCDPTLALALEGEAVNKQVQWDFTNQKLIAYTSGTALPVQIDRVYVGNSFSVDYVSATGFANWASGASVVAIRV